MKDGHEKKARERMSQRRGRCSKAATKGATSSV